MHYEARTDLLSCDLAFEEHEFAISMPRCRRMQNNFCHPIPTRSHYAKLLTWPNGQALDVALALALPLTSTLTLAQAPAISYIPPVPEPLLATQHVHWLFTNAANSSWPKSKKLRSTMKKVQVEYQLVRNPNFIPTAVRPSLFPRKGMMRDRRL